MRGGLFSAGARIDTDAMSRTLALVLLVLSLFASPASAQPEEHGPHAFTSWDVGRISLDGTSIPVVAYYPTDGGGPFPLVAVVHGAGRNLSYMAEMARTFASHGFVAVTPSIPCTPIACNHQANARQVRALLEWAVAQGALDSSPLGGLVDGERRGVVGHSWGGLAVFLAAAGHPEIDAVVTLDPNDDAGTAASMAGTVTQPNAHLMAQVMGACNATNWKDTVFPSTPAPHLRLVVTGAGHCDVEDPTDGLCALVCNAGAGITLAPVFRRYAVAFMACALEGDVAMAPYVGGSALDADQTASVIQYVSQDGLDALACRGGALADAGTIGLDAGTVENDAAVVELDAAAVEEAGAGIDASLSPPDGGGSDRDAGASPRMDGGTTPAPSAGGCGCAAAGRGRGEVLLVALGIALLGLARRARRPMA